MSSPGWHTRRISKNGRPGEVYPTSAERRKIRRIFRQLARRPDPQHAFAPAKYLRMARNG